MLRPQSTVIIKLMMSALYLLQGMFYGYVYSLPLSYQTVPNYHILGLFAAAAIPFSFKFVLAPLVQRFSVLNYGRRKIWIVTAVSLCSVVMYFMGTTSLIQTEESQKLTAALLFVCVTCITVKDIAADGLAVQILDSKTISLITFLGDQIGKIITLPLFLICISPDFFQDYWSIGPLVQKQTFIQCTAALGLLIAILIHFYFDQHKTLIALAEDDQILMEQPQSTELGMSFKQIFDHYKLFLDPTFRLCRFSILLILINQGLQIFVESYPVQLVKSGISRQKLTLSQNLCLFPNFLFPFLLSYLLTPNNSHKYYYTSTVIKYSLTALLHIVGMTSEIMILASYFIFYLVGSVHYYLQNVCLVEEAKGRFGGLSITLLLSISNLSRLTVLQKLLMDHIGYNTCIWCCLVYGFGLSSLLPNLSRRVKEGRSLNLIKQE